MAVVLVVAPQPATPVRYEIDGRHAFVGFVVRHLAVATVRGRFDKVTGALEVDTADLMRSRVEVTVDATSVNSGAGGRDEAIRSADLLDVGRFPELRFRSHHIERTADGLVAVGALTIRDETRVVRIPFTLSGPIDDGRGRKRIGIDAELRIDRRDFAVSGLPAIIGNEVRIELAVEAVSSGDT
jgi:polyisoprenoid-binding protein YceI